MDNPQFHTVDEETLESFTLQDIQSGNAFPDQVLDYSRLVPTYDQRIPRSRQDTWLTVEFGFDPTIMPHP
jgi:hypothetical protein